MQCNEHDYFCCVIAETMQNLIEHLLKLWRNKGAKGEI